MKTCSLPKKSFFDSEAISDSTMKRIKLLVVALHPIPYHVPLYRKLEQLNWLDTTVIFCDRLGFEKYYSSDWKTNVDFSGEKLLEGYKSIFIRNWALRFFNGFFSRINPGIVPKMARKEYDAVFIQGYSVVSCWLALFFSRLFGKKIIYRGESIVTQSRLKQTSFFKEALKKRILKIVFHYSDAILYSCKGNYDFFKYYGAPEEKLFPIPCAVDNDFFKNQFFKFSLERQEIRAQLDIPEDAFVCLMVGRFDDNKRQIDLLRSCVSLNRKDIYILLVGAGPNKDKLRNYAQSKGFDNIRFVGFVTQKEIGKYYSIADLFLVLSGYDMSPKTLNEAMNFSLPVVVSDQCGTVEDLIEEGKNGNGYVISVGDTLHLSKIILALADDLPLCEKMGIRSIEIVSTRATFDKDIEGINAALNHVLS